MTADLANRVESALRLPEIDGERCVHALFDQATCQACVDACPRSAWQLDDESLGLDTDACDGCGLCVPACPTGALHVEFPWQIRSIGSSLVAMLACERSGVDEPAAFVPCIHALGLRQLLLIHSAGIGYLFPCIGDCSHCHRQPAGEKLQHRLASLALMLRQRGQPPLRLLDRSSRVWRAVYRSDEVIPRGTRLGRRDFLRGGATLRQLVVLDPLNRPEARHFPPGELLPDAMEETEPLRWPWVPRLDASRCNGCDACIRLCPTGAVEMVLGEESASPSMAYRLDPKACNGCGICVDACDRGAMEVVTDTEAGRMAIPLRERRCRACGNPFHEPAEQPRSGYCRICRDRDHSRLLFQVLE
jgi:ferredoxin